MTKSAIGTIEPLNETWIENTAAFQRIAQFYGDRTAARSGVPLINHIREGLLVLEAINATDLAMQAYCVHPLAQGGVEERSLMYGLPDDVLSLAMKYDLYAGRYLCRPNTDHYNGDRLHQLLAGCPKEVLDMLYADKLQNRKDFRIYHLGTHERSAQLARYFDIWIHVLIERHTMAKSSAKMEKI